MSTSIVIPGNSANALDALVPIAERIRGNIRQTTAGIIAVERELLQARDLIDHGGFLDWLDREIGITARTAQNYMRAAEWSGAKCETVSLLPPSTVYALAAPSTSPEIEAEVIAKLEAGEPVDARAVELRIRQERVIRQRQKRPKVVSPEKRERQEREHRQWLVKREREEHEAKAAATEIVGLLSLLPEAELRRVRALPDVSMAVHFLVEQFGERATP